MRSFPLFTNTYHTDYTHFLQDPYFSPIAVLAGPKANLVDRSFVPAVTDRGLCHVYNGQTLRATYDSEDMRAKELSEVFDHRSSWKPYPILGTGKQHEVSWWINLRDK